MDERMEQIIDALEYRLAQLEDRLYREASDEDRKALERRKTLYYRAVNQAYFNA